MVQRGGGSNPPPGSVATVYRDCNYGNTAVGLPVGDYTLGQLQSRGVFNDDISSLRVSAGYQVVLYEHDNFQGAALTLRGDTPCLNNALGTGVWNDKPSSLRVQTAPASSSVTIQAEAFSSMYGVQVEACSEGGQNVGYLDQGDWLAYANVNFPTSGTYLIEYRVASVSGSRLSADLNAGATQLGQVAIPATGGWQTWQTVSQTVTVNAGTYSFGVFAQAGGWNLNWIRISKSGANRGALAASAAETTAARTSLELYPNPAANQLLLNSALDLAGSQYQILDALGRVVASGPTAAGRLDVSKLKPGRYELRLETRGRQKISRSFIKQ